MLDPSILAGSKLSWIVPWTKFRIKKSQGARQQTRNVVVPGQFEICSKTSQDQEETNTRKNGLGDWSP